MNRTKLKNYAPQARRDFIQAMTDRAAYFGLTAKKTEPVVVKGDVAVIGGRSFPIAVAKKRKALEDRIKRHGFEQTMEAMAYTWFNRLVAIRFMELHGYLEHGYRVLSHPDGKSTPEILEHAEHVELPGLKKEAVIDLKLAGNKEGELYRLLLTAQCNALHTAMPFLFERIEDETELLLPDNLLNSDSLMRKLVGEIEEADWNEVEIIGWLYQFYISEKKDEVIGKVVASEDIPAATQLFTPNWIVKYLVHNTLGRQWLATYPQSALRQQMEYYIEPAEQTPEVLEQLKAITPTSLNPEELTLLDPACGSGHILVEAYDLFKAIYQERGYRAKDIPALILQKNLFGMEIDDRAAQLAAFALMMKARSDDRRIFESEAKPNILAFEDSQGMKASEIHFALTSPLRGEKEGELESPAPDGYLFETDDNLFTRAEAAKAAASRTPTTVNFSQADIASILELFENAKAFGSLIQVPPKLAAKLPEIEKRLDDVLRHGDLTHASAHVLRPLLPQARLLSRKFDAVVANPPYMGGKGMAPSLKQYARQHYGRCTSDLFAMFVERGVVLLRQEGSLAYVTMHSWMFLPSFEDFRRFVLETTTIVNLAHLGPRAFGAISGEVVQTVAFSLSGRHIAAYVPSFVRAVDGDEECKAETLRTLKNTYRNLKLSDLQGIPGWPIAYWVSQSLIDSFSGVRLKELADIRAGIGTSNNARFLRYWFEVSQKKIVWDCKTHDQARASSQKWFPYTKGGGFRRWYGNNEFVINWGNDGKDIKEAVVNNPSDPNTTHWSRRIFNTEYFFRESLTWSDIGGGLLSVRSNASGSIHDAVGVGAYGITSSVTRNVILALLNTKAIQGYVDILCPTLHFKPGQMGEIPVRADVTALGDNSEACVSIAKEDWDSLETSRDFKMPDLFIHLRPTIKDSHAVALRLANDRITRLKLLEEENNRLAIQAYGLEGSSLCPEVPEEQITLYRPDTTEDIKRFLSYSIGCVMGRYSLDKQGLLYAHCGNEGFDPSQYKTFRADDDGIIPLLETDWGIRDDATNRFVEFIGVAWPKEHLEENLKFVADSLGATGSEQSRDTIRRYLSTGFYKHHLSMYKEEAHLLAVLQWQAASLPVPRLPAPLHRRNTRPYAH